jgi:hypothetical protein
MIINYLNFLCVVIAPYKNNTPLIINSDTMNRTLTFLIKISQKEMIKKVNGRAKWLQSEENPAVSLSVSPTYWREGFSGQLYPVNC